MNTINLNNHRLAAACAGLIMAFTCNAAMADGECDKQSIIPDPAGLPFQIETVSGKGTVCVKSGGLKGRVRAKGLVPGAAYTIWWVYFDDTSVCESSDEPPFCGLADFGFPVGNPNAVFGRFGSRVAPRNGKAHFSDSVDGMQPSSGSQVWLLMFGHGPASGDGQRLARQLLTPEDPNAGAPHLGNFVDGPLGYPVAVTVHNID